MPTDKADIFTLASHGELDVFVNKFNIKRINERDSFGSGLLHYAISGKRFEIAEFLIMNKVDINLLNNYGQTVLHLIPINPHYKIAELALQNNGDINIRDKYGNNAFWSAVFNCKGKNYEIVELYKRYNPDYLTKNNAGRSPLDFAKQINDDRLIKLIEEGI